MMIINIMLVGFMIIDYVSKVGVVLGLILVPNGKYLGKMLGDQYSHYEPESVYVMEMMKMTVMVINVQHVSLN